MPKHILMLYKQKAFANNGLAWDKVMGYAVDGENLMHGNTNSFLTRVKEKAPSIFILKCYCHTFHLMASYACLKLSKSAEQLIQDIYNYFKNSLNRRQEVTEFQHFCQIEPHKILKPLQTRWLSLHSCLLRVIEQ